MRAGMVVMRAARGVTCAGRVAAPAETAVSRLLAAATELPSGVSQPAGRAVG